jgi:hypothetical protein
VSFPALHRLILYLLLQNKLRTAKSKAKEASDIRNKAITKEAEVKKLTKSRGKFNIA